MFTLYDLGQHVIEYRNGLLSLDDFEDWFRTNSRGAYSNENAEADAIAFVEAALSTHCFEGLDEELLKTELGKISYPFVPPQVVSSCVTDSRLDTSFKCTAGSNAEFAENKFSLSTSA